MTSASVVGRHHWPLRSGGQSRLLVLGHAVAALAVLVASLGARNTGDLGRQSDWTALAVAALALGVLTSALWLLGGRRAVGRRRVDLAKAAAAIFEVPPTAAAQGDHRVATVVMSRYHRPNCQMVRGKELVTVPVEEHQRAGRTACAVCEA